MEKYAAAFIEKPLDEGISREEIISLLEKIEEGDVIPMEIQAENSVAMGFISLFRAEQMNYNLSDLEIFIKSILEDSGLENDSGKYPFYYNGFTLNILITR